MSVGVNGKKIKYGTHSVVTRLTEIKQMQSRWCVRENGVGKVEVSGILHAPDVIAS